MLRISYNKLARMVHEKNMNEQGLKDAPSKRPSAIATRGSGENITTDILLKICEAMDCKLEDIMETIKEQQ